MPLCAGYLVGLPPPFAHGLAPLVASASLSGLALSTATLRARASLVSHACNSTHGLAPLVAPIHVHDALGISEGG
ncbi:hypothetical protein GW17_00041154 [Ensete ventricosum]|nr:hypothetical protein GW17_00041154 [Ensete ventricosum]RZR97113.1 hypothetical protein BHM03_00026223 [Ensete ventricosum]